MRCPPPLPNEEERLEALSEYGLSAEVPLPSLDPIVDIAAHMFDVPAAAVNMIGRDEVFFAASQGIGDCDMARHVSFCAHAITQDEVLVVPDAQLDPRFHDNPLVNGGLIRFYAGVPLRSASGHAVGALCVVDDKPHARFGTADKARLRDLGKLVMDKLELRRLEVAAEASRRRFEESAAVSPNAVIGFDAQARVTAWNHAAESVFGYSAAIMVGRPLEDLIEPQDRPKVRQGIARLLGSDELGGVSAEYTAVRSNGERMQVQFVWSRWQEGGRTYFGAIARDLDNRDDREALHKLVNFDSITGLPNRAMMQRQIDQAIRDGRAAALLLVDLDDFKDINSTLGQAAGDEVLRTVADRIRTAVPPSALLGRIGGDEFAVLLAQENASPTPNAIAREAVAAIGKPILVHGHDVRIGAGCGIALAPRHGDTSEALIGSADLALFEAKSGGRDRTCLFKPSLRDEAVKRRIHDAALYRAAERGEFRLFYQPQIRLSDGALVGAEALIRWQHPQHGLLAPAAFLSALESGPLAARIGKWTLDCACAQIAQWRRIQSDLRVSVNLFAEQVTGDDLVEHVRDALAAHKLPPEALELEITENIVLSRQDAVKAQLQDLNRHGIALMFDDFGTGFASLNLLRDFPVTGLKIDMSFIQAMLLSPRDRAIVLSLLDLARQFDLSVVAEGVEIEAQHDFLRDHHCETGQGYYYGKPVPADLFSEQHWLDEIDAH